MRTFLFVATGDISYSRTDIGYRILRAVDQVPLTYVEIGLALANVTSYADTPPSPTTGYRYQVIAFNAAGDSTSNVVALPAPLVAPTGLGATVATGPQVSLTWTDNATNENGFVVECPVITAVLGPRSPRPPPTPGRPRQLHGLGGAVRPHLYVPGPR